MVPNGDLPIAAGATVVVRDEEWLVRSVSQTQADGLKVEVRGTSELVRDQMATFFTSLDDIDVLDPAKTRLVTDDSPNYLRSRLWLEAVMRETPIPMSDTRIATGHRGLLDHMPYQLRPAHLALTNPHPRLLIADAVGLGKTLEIGIVLSDLIRRGRGERILVVTPRAVLEQFQHEMWTRFAIPLVRLDSEGIQKVRQTLPTTRNPFSYYRRVIVSIDTLKNPVRYRHHLEQQRWDAVVIDECHNVINRGNQNHRLATLLAKQTDALILASATPHNGKPESFAELIQMLDPTAIKDKSHYTARDIESLYVRRHRNSDDVKHEVGDRWAARLDPHIVAVSATKAEQAVLSELQSTWLHPPDDAPDADKRRRLFPWTLFKSFLSSPSALHQTIGRRLKTIADLPDAEHEERALRSLAELNGQALTQGPSKLAALIRHLQAAGIGSGKPVRVVIFSERIPTLQWLGEQLRARLSLKPEEITVLHAQQPDSVVQTTVEQFGLSSSPLRVLLASDMASEGLNLHLQCHQLIHYDLPWSLIRIQQRNGRIDRYMQTSSPHITALALSSSDPDVPSDIRIVTRLLQKEHAANQALGDAGVLLNLRDADAEEEAVMAALQEQLTIDDLVPEVEDVDPNAFDVLFATGGTHSDEGQPLTAQPPTLFHDEDNFLYAALTDLFPSARGGLKVTREAEQDLIAFDTPPDLAQMLRDLPASYLRDRQVSTRMRLTGDPNYAQQRLDRARDQGDTLWPDVHFLSPNHPVLSWASGRLLARLERNDAPVMAAAVKEPIFLTQALWSNHRGQAAIVRWSAITGLGEGEPRVGDLLDALASSGISEQAINPGYAPGLDHLQAMVPTAVQAAVDDLTVHRQSLEEPLRELVEAEEARVSEWALFAMDEAEQSAMSLRRRKREHAERTSGEALDYLRSLMPTGNPFVRVVGVIAPIGAE